MDRAKAQPDNIFVFRGISKRKENKLESRIDMCPFVGYPRGTKGGLFYDPKDKKVMVSTYVRFLEEDHIMNHKPNEKNGSNKINWCIVRAKENATRN